MKSNHTKKKILFFMTSLRMGGGERVSVDLMNRLVKNGDKVFLAVMEDEGMCKELLSQDVKIIHLKTKSIGKASIRFFYQILKQKPNIVFSTYIHLNPIVIFSTFFFRNTKAIIRIGAPFSLLFQEFKSFKDRRILLWLTKWLYPHASKIICVADCIKQDLQSFVSVSSQKIIVMYSPKDTKEIIEKSNQEKPTIFQQREEPFFLFVGRLTSAKDPETLLDAFDLYKKEGRKGTLLFVGDGIFQTILEEKTREYSLQNDVVFLGTQKNPYPFMKKATSIVLSSTSEGLPNVLLEALVLQKPVVATDCFPGGAREVIKPTQAFEGLEESSLGILVPVQNPELLKKAMVRVIETSSYQPVFPERLTGSKSEIWSIF